MHGRWAHAHACCNTGYGAIMETRPFGRKTAVHVLQLALPCTRLPLPLVRSNHGDPASMTRFQPGPFHVRSAVMSPPAPPTANA
jgi:hypothetical protein